MYFQSYVHIHDWMLNFVSIDGVLQVFVKYNSLSKLSINLKKLLCGLVNFNFGFNHRIIIFDILHVGYSGDGIDIFIFSVLGGTNLSSTSVSYL